MLLPLQIPNVDEKEIAAADSLLRAGLQTKVKTFAGMTWEERFHSILNDIWHLGLKVLVVIVIFIVGRWLIKKIVKWLNNLFEKREVDASLRTFIRSLVNIVLYIVLFYLIIAYLGVNTSLFVAIFAAAGLAIGMALSGVFQNFAGGVMILLLRPFKVGDWISAQGQSGSVTDIRLFNTELRTADNQVILLPNGSVSTSIVTNTNAAGTRRVEWVIGIEYGSDFEAARKVISGIIESDKRILKTPAPGIFLSSLGDSAINITIQVWCTSGDYWGVFYDTNAAIYRILPEKGFGFPFPQMDVTLTASSDAPAPPAPSK